MKLLISIILLFLTINAFANDSSFYAMTGAVKSYKLQARNNTYRPMQYGFIEKLDKDFSLGAIYFNEGHLPNNHRDGYAVAGWHSVLITNGLYASFGFGPYYSVSTTKQDGNYLDNNSIGVISMLALNWYPQYSNWFIRVQLNKVNQIDSFDTDSIFVGLGIDTDDKVKYHYSPHELSFWYGDSLTTIPNTPVERGFILERKFLKSKNTSSSIDLIIEGNTKISNRFGVANQWWYAMWKSDRVSGNIGVGPYFAIDNTTKAVNVMPIISWRVTYKVSNSYDVGGNFTRVVSGHNKDQDMFLFGIVKHF